MLSHIFDVLGKTNTRPMFIVFLALSIATLGEGRALVENPFAVHAMVLPIGVLLACVLTSYWTDIVIRLDSSLSEYDLLRWSTIISYSLIAFGLLIVFSYFGRNPDGPTFSILREARFIHVVTLFLWALDTDAIGRL